MRTRRDQVQAYRFSIRRVVSAVLSGEPEAVERPMRRLGLSMFASSMVATLLVAGAGIWGLVTGQGRELTDEDEPMLVVESGTHTRYVYLDGVLYPVQNLASARLILGTSDPAQRDNVSRATLRNIPRGPTLGIAHAPDALPPADELVELPWQLCSVPPSADRPEPETTLVLGEEIPGGFSPGNQALYLTADDETYLAWEDHLLHITDSRVPIVLNVGAVQPTVVGVPLINAVTAGPNLGNIEPDGYDPNGSEVTSYEINGQLAEVGFLYQTGSQYYIMTREGLRPIGEMAVEIRKSRGRATIREISGAEVTRNLDRNHANEPIEPPGYPLEIPQMHSMTGQNPTVCAVYRDREDGNAVGIEVHEGAPAGLTPSIVLQQSDDDRVAAPDRLRLPPGRGALVMPASTSGTAFEEATVYLITDVGVRYPIGSHEAKVALGYGDVPPVPVPSSWLELIPIGPTLDIDQARRGAPSLEE